MVNARSTTSIYNTALRWIKVFSPNKRSGLDYYTFPIGISKTRKSGG
jgi:hypothetical protein